MKTRFLKAAVVAMGAAGLIAPRAGAAEPVVSIARSSVQPMDVALSSQKTLHGQVVSVENAPLAGQKVTLSTRGQLVAATTTDARGAFQLPVARGGVYVVSAGDSEKIVRTWTGETAPPAARDGVLMVNDGQAVRGQAGSWIAQNIVPLGLVGGMAGAIASQAVGDDTPAGS